MEKPKNSTDKNKKREIFYPPETTKKPVGISDGHSIIISRLSLNRCPHQSKLRLHQWH
jgi:hypothetical protein